MDALTPMPLKAPWVARPREPLRVLGTSVTQIEPVKQAAEEDLGLALEFITLDGTAAQRRGGLAPATFDVYDQWFHDLDLVWPTGSLQPIALSRVPRWGDANALSRTGGEAQRAAYSDPSRNLFVQLDATLGATPTDAISMLPTVHNADGFAVVGDMDATSWGAFLDPAHAGSIVLHSDPAIGAVEFALAMQAAEGFAPANPFDLSVDEIDTLVARLSAALSAGQFLRVWTDEAEAIAAMGRGAPTMGTLWWSGVIRLRAEGVPVRMVMPAEGCRGWFGGLALSTLATGYARDAAYDYLNWWLEGRAGAILARNGAYMAAPAAVRRHLSAAEWDFWYGGEPAAETIRDPLGRAVYGAGDVRGGGSYAERMSQIVVWDTVMTEHNYLVRRWDDALATPHT
ncbi:extracellular solute-binding protein [Acuticoccus sp. MNP-M23]|uniref:ABC transporter substrate-binding protein n=1 Tax=Acuticoccus sp. MNP-M23 TaxID=3072793 RepID=UPI002815D698|nr:extracellular solute-binding protein [Acuticoccus sp. MNP-M23]WMS41350.1 extracellular solute-binding protein [Acuticoccus sp. MNP-M23]